MASNSALVQDRLIGATRSYSLDPGPSSRIQLNLKEGLGAWFCGGWWSVGLKVSHGGFQGLNPGLKVRFGAGLRSSDHQQPFPHAAAFGAGPGPSIGQHLRGQLQIDLLKRHRVRGGYRDGTGGYGQVPAQTYRQPDSSLGLPYSLHLHHEDHSGCAWEHLVIVAFIRGTFCKRNSCILRSIQGL
jgi:hypothetical protein